MHGLSRRARPAASLAKATPASLWSEVCPADDLALLLPPAAVSLVPEQPVSATAQSTGLSACCSR
jgi:hypothetical protein